MGCAVRWGLAWPVLLLVLPCCGGVQQDLGPLEVWAGYDWERVYESQVPIEELDFGLPVVVHRELAGRVGEIAKLAGRTGLWRLALVQERDGLLVGHSPEPEGFPYWVDCGSEDAAPGWRCGVLAFGARPYVDLAIHIFEWHNCSFSLGTLWRQGGEVELNFLTQEPVCVGEEKVPPAPIDPELLSLFRSRVRAQVGVDGLRWVRDTFVLNRRIAGKFRQIKLWGRGEDPRGLNVLAYSFLDLERFLVPRLKLVGTPEADGGDAETRAFLWGNFSMRARPKKGLDILLLVRRGVSLFIEGTEVREQIELLWDSKTKKLTLGECR